MNEMSKNEAPTKAQIKTFVFFDLETTGFIQGSNAPKIVEMSLVATTRDSLFDKKGGLPRIMHKLTIPLQPLKPIPFEVSQITGLYNDLLEQEKPFDQQAYELLNTFIGRLCPPICFVAHNGIRFDYPILLSELNRIGRDLSDNILCIDSLTAFKSLFDYNDSKESKNDTVSKTVDENSVYFDDGLDAELLAVLDSPETDPSTSAENECFDVDFNHARTLQKLNETTPTHKTTNPSNGKPCKVSKKKNAVNAKKRLPFTRGGPKNFKLGTVYEHLVGRELLNAHSAETDCLAMLTCVMKMSDSFVNWADDNASPLVQYALK